MQKAQAPNDIVCFDGRAVGKVQVVQNEGSKTNAANAKVQELTEEASKM